jgi:transcriptional regulator with XRE-family HTH domain
MTPTTLRAALAAIGWSQTDLARELGCSDRLVRRWAAGAQGYAIPGPVAAWLLDLAACHVKRPAPKDWQTRRGVANEPIPSRTPAAPHQRRPA